MNIDFIPSHIFFIELTTLSIGDIIPFHAFFTPFTTPFHTELIILVNPIKNIWDGIKSMFKLPHFSITGKFSLSPPSIPKVSVDWYYNGGIFKSPTVLGGIGVGDAFNGQGSNAEAIVPLDEMYRNITFLVVLLLISSPSNSVILVK